MCTNIYNLHHYSSQIITTVSDTVYFFDLLQSSYLCLVNINFILSVLCIYEMLTAVVTDMHLLPIDHFSPSIPGFMFA
jgi:hypothetical protein